MYVQHFFIPDRGSSGVWYCHSWFIYWMGKGVLVSSMVKIACIFDSSVHRSNFLYNFTPLSQSNWHLYSHLLNWIKFKTRDILLSWKCQAITFLLGIFLSNKHRISKDKQSRHFSRLNLLPVQNSLSKYQYMEIKDVKFQVQSFIYSLYIILNVHLRLI